MNTFINNQLLEVLFYKKNVPLHNQIYHKYFYDIFDCPADYINFLTSHNREQQLFHAKKIIKRISFGSFNQTLYNAFLNLISFEDHELANTNVNYVPRDHSIHSINTYLLGVYLFFSTEIFFNNICDYFNEKITNPLLYYEHKLEKGVLTFIQAWKIFALNHDLGYPVELISNQINHTETRNIKSKEYLNFINDLAANQKIDYCFYELTLLSAFSILLSFSHSNLEATIGEHAKNLNNIKTDILQYKKLDKIYSITSFNYFKSILDYKKLIIIIKDKNLENKILYYYDEKSTLFLPVNLSFDTHSEKLPFESFKRFDYDENFNMELYYPINDDCSLKSTMGQNSAYENDVTDFSNYLLDKHAISYSSITNCYDYINFLFEIYEYLMDELNHSHPTKSHLFDYLKEFFLTDIEKKIKKKSVRDEASLKEQFNCYINGESLSTRFNDFLCKKGEQDNNSAYTLGHLKNQIESLIQIDSKDFNLFFNIDENDLISIKPLPSFVTIKEVFNYFKTLSIEAGLCPSNFDIFKLIKYCKKDTNRLDHGISSTFLLIETYFIFSALQNNIASCNSMKFFSVDLISKEIFFNGCYAIFVHNVYAKTFNRIWSEKEKIDKQVKHNIITNPFVYFCLFCDNMQIWDRPLIISQGLSQIRKPTISSSEMFISVENNKINVKCISKDISDILTNYRDSLDEYLSNASKLISLEIIDKY